VGRPDAAHIGADSSLDLGVGRSSPPSAAWASRNFSASSGEAVEVTLLLREAWLGRLTAWSIPAPPSPYWRFSGVLLDGYCMTQVSRCLPRRCGEQECLCLPGENQHKPRKRWFDQPGGSPKTSASKPCSKRSRCIVVRKSAGMIAPTGWQVDPVSCCRQETAGRGRTPSPRSR